MDICRRAGESARDTDFGLYLDELSHRTINDYTAMLAALEFARRNVADDASRSALDQVARRLRSAALAYRVLQPPANNAPQRLDHALEHTGAALCASLLEGRAISLTLMCDPVELTGPRCWQACLVVSELIRNAVRHAFADRDEGAIFVELRTNGAQVCCTVSDNGRAPDVVLPGRGTAILEGLAGRLDGKIRRVHTPAGSLVALTFPACGAAPMAGPRCSGRHDMSDTNVQ
jgi:two-component sensor histidine kinase